MENTEYTHLIWLLDISTLSSKGQKGPLTHSPCLIYHSKTPVFLSFHTFLSNSPTHTQRRACKHRPQLSVFSFNSAPASAKPLLPRDPAANLTE